MCAGCSCCHRPQPWPDEPARRARHPRGHGAAAITRGSSSSSWSCADTAQRGERAAPAGCRGPRRPGRRSAPECELRDLVSTSGVLPEPRWNAPIRIGGRLLGIADGWWPEALMAAEVNSREHHFAEGDWEATMQRQAGFAAHGILVIPVSPEAHPVGTGPSARGAWSPGGCHVTSHDPGVASCRPRAVGRLDHGGVRWQQGRSARVVNRGARRGRWSSLASGTWPATRFRRTRATPRTGPVTPTGPASPSCWRRRSPRSAAASGPGRCRWPRRSRRRWPTGSHLLVQAGTGTGKSLAYLVPALLHDGRGRRRDGHDRAAEPGRRP